MQDVIQVGRRIYPCLITIGYGGKGNDEIDATGDVYGGVGDDTIKTRFR